MSANKHVPENEAKHFLAVMLRSCLKFILNELLNCSDMVKKQCFDIFVFNDIESWNRVYYIIDPWSKVDKKIIPDLLGMLCTLLMRRRFLSSLAFSNDILEDRKKTVLCRIRNTGFIVFIQSVSRI